jgi:hypothetical protein
MQKASFCYQVVDGHRRSPLFESLKKLREAVGSEYRADAVIIEYQMNEVNHWVLRIDPQIGRHYR